MCLTELTVSTDLCEACAVENRPNPRNSKLNYIIFGFYKPPNSPKQQFIEYELDKKLQGLVDSNLQFFTYTVAEETKTRS